MRYIIQVILTTDEGRTETREIACLERENLTPTTLGLSLNEGKAILKALQLVQSVEMDFDAAVAASSNNTARKLLKAAEEFHTYIEPQ
jgi:hypothetical protein